jgi:uncharacterized membrane protein YebE (DUF533 family)
MNTQELLDQLLATGRQIAEKGKELANEGADYASKYVEIPEAGPERDALLKKVGAGAAATGLLALLIGTKTGRKTLSPAIKLGSLAAVGALGYKVWQNYQEKSGTSVDTEVAPLPLEGPAAEKRSLAILRAMISASKADGHVDSQENAAIKEQIQSSGIEGVATEVLLEEMSREADPSGIANLADSQGMAIEIYLASLLIVGQQIESEKQYLSELAQQLKLQPDLVAEIERQAALVS